MAYFKAHLRGDHIFMDVGANIGYFTVLCAPLVARVIAFEPLVSPRRYCVFNVATLANVAVLPYALWHEDAESLVLDDPVNLGSGSLAQSGNELIQCRALDGLVESGALPLPRLDMVKMDIQGAEVSALLGMRRTLERHRPAIILEVDRVCLERLGRSVGDWWTLVGFGYRLAAFEPWKVSDPEPLAP